MVAASSWAVAANGRATDIALRNGKQLEGTGIELWMDHGCLAMAGRPVPARAA
jgi:hypothetical protein